MGSHEEFKGRDAAARVCDGGPWWDNGVERGHLPEGELDRADDAGRRVGERSAIPQRVHPGQQVVRAVVDQAGDAELRGDDLGEVLVGIDRQGGDSPARILDAADQVGAGVGKGSASAQGALDGLHQVETGIPGEGPTDVGLVADGAEDAGVIVGEGRAVGLGLGPTGGARAHQRILAGEHGSVIGTGAEVRVTIRRRVQADWWRVDRDDDLGEAVVGRDQWYPHSVLLVQSLL